MMDPKAEIQKFLKDVQSSAREFAVYGLTMSTKALDYTATRLKTLEETLKERADRLAATEKNDAEAATETPSTDSNK